MRVAAVLTTIVAVAAAKSLKFMTLAAETEYEWRVTNWMAGCAQSGCSYDFEIQGPALNTRPHKPAFRAHCGGAGEGSPYRLCAMVDNSTVALARRVAAKLLPQPTGSNSTVVYLQVSYKFTDLQNPTTWWNYTGHTNTSYNQDVSPKLDFTIIPDEIFGVA